MGNNIVEFEEITSRKQPEFKEITYEECAGFLSKFPSRLPIFYFNGGQLHQIKTPEEFITVVSSQLKVYTQTQLSVHNLGGI